MQMKRTLCGLLMVALLAIASPPLARGDLSGDVIVQDVQASLDSVRGRTVNPKAAELRDIRMLVTHTFHWADEMHPGEDNPSRSDIFTIPGPIPPRGSISFEEKLVPPLPARADGHFVTSVEILGFTEVGP
jgi:hypothetical protein